MIKNWDDRRDYVIEKKGTDAVAFAVEHWIHSAERAIQQRGRFAVALSGGSTPKAIYESLAQSAKLDWEKIWLFWSDERAAAPDHPNSNYKMAMDAGFSRLKIPPSQIFRMKAESNLEQNSRDYDELIRRHLGPHLFDLVMLGVGEDGHTASLFPNTKALSITDRFAAPNFIPDKKEERMTLTFPCINQSRQTVLYVIGASKQNIVPKIFNAPILSPYPASQIGTSSHKALFIFDEEASKFLKKSF